MNVSVYPTTFLNIKSKTFPWQRKIVRSVIFCVFRATSKACVPSVILTGIHICLMQPKTVKLYDCDTAFEGRPIGAGTDHSNRCKRI
jgi:hypothetical protein